MSKKSQNHGKSYQQSQYFYRKFLSKCAQVIVLFMLMALFSGHERSNPKIGESLVDFYLEQTITEVKTQSTILLLNSIHDTAGCIESLINKITYEFYYLRDFNPVWTYNYTTTGFFRTLSNFIDSLDYFGIPEKYVSSRKLRNLEDTMSKYKDDKDLNHRIALEIHTTRLFYKTLLYLNRGIFKNDTSVYITELVTELPLKVQQAIKKNSLSVFLHTNQPDLLPYRNLIKSIPNFIDCRRIIHTYSIDKKSIGDTLLANYLYFTGFLDRPAFDSINTKTYVIEKLQKLANLEQSGVLDQVTFIKIKELIDERYATICLNLDRLRKFEPTGGDYLFVNIPSYHLEVIKDEQKMLDFNVVVGHKSTPTPILSSKINKIVANPFWTVPKSIANNEMLHKIRRDSNYLCKNGYMIINNSEKEVDNSSIDWEDANPLGNEYWIRQKYGKGNALGKVKFIFPNQHRVYLHDTPSKSLFNRQDRAFSHGCIRLENPGILAQYFFDTYIVQQKKLSFTSMVKSRKRQVVFLPIQIPIHIQYLTCMGNEKGELEFYQDIYKHDKVLQKIFISSNKTNT